MSVIRELRLALGFRDATPNRQADAEYKATTSEGGGAEPEPARHAARAETYCRLQRAKLPARRLRLGWIQSAAG